MPGGGTKLAITTHNPARARLLDLTRTARRAGRVPTGVDRVELAYAHRFLAETEPVFGLIRSSLGYVLLDRAGMAGFLERAEGRRPWGPPDRLSRISRRLDNAGRAVESDLRRLSLARCLPQRLGKMLAQHVPEGASYVNTGHSNLTNRVLFAVKQSLNAPVSVLIHDTIPLDFPQYQRPGTPDQFAQMLRRVRKAADLLICNSRQTAEDVQKHMSQWGAVPDCLVAPLGVPVPQPGTAPFPQGFDENRPYFATIGTIEPRKNHALLLDMWERLSGKGIDPMPQLLILGARGWNNEAVFKRLDAKPPHVFEQNGLDDAAIWGLAKGADALLFPSLAEGYGLPPLEARALGIPVICNTLPIYAETLGNNAIYADASDVYLWETIISDMARDEGAVSALDQPREPMPVPGWDAHFNTVLSRV